MSSSPEESVQSCSACGASIYPEHLTSGLAAYRAGKLVCAYCLSDSVAAGTAAAAARPAGAPAGAARPAAGAPAGALAAAGARAAGVGLGAAPGAVAPVAGASPPGTTAAGKLEEATGGKVAAGAAGPVPRPAGASVGEAGLDSLALIDEAEMSGGGERTTLHGFGAGSPAEALLREKKEYQRPLNVGGHGATRVRVFHSKLSDAAAHHLEEQVNSWLDAHRDVEVKFAQTIVGMWEGKHTEPNLILIIFY